MEIVSEGSLESISRPASCDNAKGSCRDLRLSQKSGQIMGFLEELPPEEMSVSSLEEDVESEDDSVIISQVENDVVVEDIFERSATTQSNVTDENIEDEENADSDETSDKNGHVVKYRVSQDEDRLERDLDPKIKKGLRKIQKLDAILAEKQQKEKDVKTHRRRLEKKWREEFRQLDKLREQEGHGKMDLGVGHALALGAPPNDDNQPDEIESVPTAVTPLFSTQPLPHEHLSSDRGITSSCDSLAEQDVNGVESRNSKKSQGRKGSKQSKPKGKEQNFVKRNIELAAAAGNVIPMTEAEKKRLEELLSDETDLLMVENAYSEGLSLPAGEGFTLDSESVSSLADIDRKLHDLVPEEEIDLLSTGETWRPLRDLDHSSQDASSVKGDTEIIGLGERILREEKEMREMKRRLLAIEADLQALYRDSREESVEVSLSEQVLQKLIGRSSRTTSQSTTVSESVMSALSTARTTDATINDEEFQLAPTLRNTNSNTRSESKKSSHSSIPTGDGENKLSS